MLLNRGVNKIGGLKQPTFGNGLSNKGIAAGKHPHNDGLDATTTKRGPRPAALIETTQPPTNGSCLPKPPTIGNYWENPKAGLSTAFLPKQGFLKLMAQSRAHTKIPGKASAGGWRWVQPAIFRLRASALSRLGVACGGRLSVGPGPGCFMF